MDGKTLAVGAVIVAILALGGGAAVAAQQREEPKVDRASAEEAALGAVPGEVKETELEREGGSAVYEVEVAGKDGRLREVTVDAADGRVLGQEMEEDDYGSDDQDTEDQGPEGAEEDVGAAGADRAGHNEGTAEKVGDEKPSAHPREPAEGSEEDVEAPGADRAGDGG